MRVKHSALAQMENQKPTFSPRIRFNWGFWDARNDRDARRYRRDPMPAWDKFYCAGYEAGKHSQSDTSDSAWEYRNH